MIVEVPRLAKLNFLVEKEVDREWGEAETYMGNANRIDYVNF